MTKLFSTDYKYDLSLESDGSNRFLVWIIACLVYIASLAILAALSSHTMLQDWKNYAETRITVQIPYSPTADKSALGLSDQLRGIDGIKTVKIVPPEDTAHMLQTVTGTSAHDLSLLPMPVFIDLTLDHPDNQTRAIIEETVFTYNSEYTVERHNDWASDIIHFGRTLFTAALGLVILAGAMTVLTVIWSLTSRVNVHHDEIEILSIVGADDNYIAKQFQHFALSRTFTGCIIGALLAVITLGIVFFSLSSPPLVNITIMIGWLFVPLAVCIVIAYVTSRITLYRAFSKLGA